MEKITCGYVDSNRRRRLSTRYGTVAMFKAVLKVEVHSSGVVGGAESMQKAGKMASRFAECQNVKSHRSKRS